MTFSTPELVTPPRPPRDGKVYLTSRRPKLSFHWRGQVWGPRKIKQRAWLYIIIFFNSFQEPFLRANHIDSGTFYMIRRPKMRHSAVELREGRAPGSSNMGEQPGTSRGSVGNYGHPYVKNKMFRVKPRCISTSWDITTKILVKVGMLERAKIWWSEFHAGKGQCLILETKHMRIN